MLLCFCLLLAVEGIPQGKRSEAVEGKGEDAQDFEELTAEDIPVNGTLASEGTQGELRR